MRDNKAVDISKAVSGLFCVMVWIVGLEFPNVRHLTIKYSVFLDRFMFSDNFRLLTER